MSSQPTHADSLNAMRVYVGTYTTGESRGIYQFEFDPRTGTLTPKGLAAEAVNPSFLALHTNGHWLYAIGEVDDFNGHKAGGLSAFEIEADGKLKLLDKQPSGGRGPCHVSIHPSGKFAAVANFGGGSVAVMPIDEHGRLAPAVSIVQHVASDPATKAMPRAHSLNFDAAGRYAYVPDRDLNKVFIYRLGADGLLAPADPAYVATPSGSGPRHMAFHPTGRFAYVNTEKACTIVVFACDADHGRLTELQTVSTLPTGVTGDNTTAEIAVHPSGRFLYCSVRGHDSIAIFAIDSAGRLSLIEHELTRGDTPRHFAIDPTGNWLIAANQTSNNLAAFRIDSHTGRLQPCGELASVPNPVCVLFVPEL